MIEFLKIVLISLATFVLGHWIGHLAATSQLENLVRRMAGLEQRVELQGRGLNEFRGQFDRLKEVHHGRDA